MQNENTMLVVSTPIAVTETDEQTLSKLPDGIRDLFEEILLSQKIKEI